jgi:hypothetical protein
MNKMKHIFVAVVFAMFSFVASAQHIADTVLMQIPEGYELVDSVVYIPAAVADSTLCGVNVFSAMPSKVLGDKGDVKIHQSSAIRDAMGTHIDNNASRTILGYRVRIFFDNKQTARNDSEAALKLFTSKYHGVAAYRSYVNPYFKVTVGDFRTKSEAVQLMKLIQVDFPAAFVVKENIYYPVVDKENSYIVDTIKVLRPIVADAPVQ